MICSISWRGRVRVELTIRSAKERITGFEGRESHRTLFAPANSIAERQDSNGIANAPTTIRPGDSRRRLVSRIRFFTLESWTAEKEF